MDKSKISVAVFDKYAQQYQDKFMDLSQYHDTFDLFCAAIGKTNAEVLEIGCGPGNITRYLLNKRPNLKILGTDLAPNMIELAKINNPGAEFKIFDCRDIGKLVQKYDAIMGGFCLPYLSREEAIAMIADASKILRPKGILYLSTMEDDYSKSGFKASSSNSADRAYIYYHQADYLTAALEDNGFEIVDFWRKDYVEADGKVTKDLVVLARK